MLNNSNKKRAFTLVELLVAVALSVIVVGATVSIFASTSNVLTASEERIAIFQNARAALQSISEDISNATTSESFILELKNPSDSSNNQLLMKFATITSWLDSSSLVVVRGKARAYFYLEESNNRWRLKRHLVRDNIDNEPNPIGDETFPETLSDDVMCEFIVQDDAGVPSISVDYFFYHDPDPSDTDDTQVLEIRSPTGANSTVFDESASDLNLPLAVRLNIDITDEKQRAVRTLSRMFWLTNAK